MSQPAAPANLNIRVFTQSGPETDVTSPAPALRLNVAARMRQPSGKRTTLYDCRHCPATLPSTRRFFHVTVASARLWERPPNRAWWRYCCPRLGRYQLPLGRTAQSPHATENYVSIRLPHSDRGDAVKRSDFIAVDGDKTFVVLVEEGGYLGLIRPGEQPGGLSTKRSRDEWRVAHQL